MKKVTVKKEKKVKKAKQQMNFSIVAKILAVTLASMLILVFLSISTMQDIGDLVADRLVETQLKSTAYSVERLVMESMEEGSDTDQANIMKQVSEETQVDGIVFIGSRMITSSLKDASGNELTKVLVPDDVYQQLMSGKTVFVKNHVVGDISYFGYYEKFGQNERGQAMIAFICKKTNDITSIYNGEIVARVTFTVFASAFAMAVIFFVVMKISNALKTSVKEVVKVSEGKLNFAVSDKLMKRGDEVGEMGRTVQTLVTNLHKIVDDINDSSVSLDGFTEQFKENFEQINDAIVNVNVAMEEIAKGATDQASEVQVVLDQMSGMGDAIDSTSGNVDALMDSAESMQAQNNLMNSTLDELVAISDKTTGSIKEVYEQTNNTNKSALEIRSAIEIITDIADQTNLLSLNASIEAARAGEQGRGFAVVADQVRMLADQSSESAAVISGIVEELIKNANVSVETMNQVLSALRTQEDKLADTRKVFGVLNEEISNVTAAVENISGQVDAIGKVKDGVQSSFDSLAAISQENAASTEETSAAMSELGRIVEECNTTVDEVVELSGKLVDEMKQFEL